MSFLGGHHKVIILRAPKWPTEGGVYDLYCSPPPGGYHKVLPLHSGSSHVVHLYSQWSQPCLKRSCNTLNNDFY